MKNGIRKYLFYSVFIHLVLISAFLLSLVELGHLSFSKNGKSDLTHVSVYKNPVKKNNQESVNFQQSNSHGLADKQQRNIKKIENAESMPRIKKTLNTKNQYKITKNSSKISLEQSEERNILLQQDAGNKLKKEIVKGGYENNEAESVKSIAKPEYGTNKKPEYPLVARRRGYEGEVVFNVQVLDDGNVGDLEIVKTSGYTVLDNSALNALKKWKFVPGKFNGKFIPSWVKIPIQFRLNEI